MNLKILTLNVWRMYEWDRRMPLLVNFIQKNQPDIIILQEAQLDWNISPINQIEQLNSKLKYPSSIFAPSGLRHSQRGESIVPPSQIGHGVLSKYPLLNIEQWFLTKNPDDKDQRTLLNFDIKTDSGMIYFSSVHFSNSDAWAEAHLKEALALLHRTGKNRILAGDFNIFNLSNYHSLYFPAYCSSGDVYKYISYPERNGTLDYILTPQEYSFTSFICVDEPLSDHRALLAEINCPE